MPRLLHSESPGPWYTNDNIKGIPVLMSSAGVSTWFVPPHRSLDLVLQGFRRFQNEYAAKGLPSLLEVLFFGLPGGCVFLNVAVTSSSICDSP